MSDIEECRQSNGEGEDDSGEIEIGEELVSPPESQEIHTPTESWDVEDDSEEVGLESGEDLLSSLRARRFRLAMATPDTSGPGLRLKPY